MQSIEESIKAGMPELVTYINERSANIVRYSDKLSEALIQIDKYFEAIGPKAGVKFTDSEDFYSENTQNEGKISYRLRVSKDWGLYAHSDCEYIDSINIRDASRAMKKAAIIRLPGFIQSYADALKKLELEYEDVSEKAAQIAAILV
jgi:hypothetical protein